MVVLDRHEVEEAHELLRSSRPLGRAEGRGCEAVEDAARRVERAGKHEPTALVARSRQPAEGAAGAAERGRPALTLVLAGEDLEVAGRDRGGLRPARAEAPFVCGSGVGELVEQARLVGVEQVLLHGERGMGR